MEKEGGYGKKGFEYAVAENTGISVKTRGARDTVFAEFSIISASDVLKFKAVSVLKAKCNA